MSRFRLPRVCFAFHIITVSTTSPYQDEYYSQCMSDAAGMAK